MSRGVKRIQEDSSQNESRGKGVQRKLRDGSWKGANVEFGGVRVKRSQEKLRGVKRSL